jgi:hypothetical protein
MMSERADCRRGRDQPDPLRGGAEVRGRRTRRAARGGQGYRRGRGQDPRDCKREQGCACWKHRRWRVRLYKHTDIDDEIPEALYSAVAEVLAYVYQLRAYGKGDDQAISGSSEQAGGAAGDGSVQSGFAEEHAA